MICERRNVPSLEQNVQRLWYPRSAASNDKVKEISLENEGVVLQGRRASGYRGGRVTGAVDLRVGLASIGSINQTVVIYRLDTNLLALYIF